MYVVALRFSPSSCSSTCRSRRSYRHPVTEKMGDSGAFDTTGPLAGMSAPVPEAYVQEEVNVAEIEMELEKLDQRLKTDSDNIATWTRYGELCLKIDKKERALPAVKRGLELFSRNPISGNLLETLSSSATQTAIHQLPLSR